MSGVGLQEGDNFSIWKGTDVVLYLFVALSGKVLLLLILVLQGLPA